MSSPKRPVALPKPRRDAGSAGRRRDAALKGMVKSGRDCPPWRHEPYEKLHFAGQELTVDLGDAPHAAQVFKRSRVKAAGKLADA